MGGGQVLTNSPQFSGLSPPWESDREEEEESSDVIWSNDETLSGCEEHNEDEGDEEVDVVCSNDEASMEVGESNERGSDAVCRNTGSLLESEGSREEAVKGSSSCLASPTSEKYSLQAELRRRIIRHYENLATGENLRHNRKRLRRYTPGLSSLYAKGGKEITTDVTALLVVGYKGAGKSTLINNVIGVFNNKSAGLYRAQVTDDPTENGTYFISEYMILGSPVRPKMSMFDTRGLSEESFDESKALLESWMKDGVHHGQMDLRASDNDRVKESLETRGRLGDAHFRRKRNVNFVIFVIDAVSAFQMMKVGDRRKEANLVQLYKNPFLTFKDDRPVVVMTHGDKLSRDDRISARTYIGEILGIPPVEQIFDISGTRSVTDSADGMEDNTVQDSTVLEMLTFALECADRNLPPKRTLLASVQEVVHSLVQKYAALDAERKAALVGMIICAYILLILSIVSSVSFFFLMKKMLKRHKGHFW